MGMWDEELGVFDLETTGVDVESARIVSAHVGVLDGRGEVTTRHDWLVDPGVDIPAQAQAVHGISTERARAEGRDASEAIAEIVTALGQIMQRGVPVVAYNAPYDLTLLDREARRHGLVPLDAPSPVIDPLVLDRAVDTYRRGKRTLDVTCAHYGVVLDGAHDAAFDAIAAGRLAQEMVRRYPAELDVDAVALHEAQVRWAREQAADFQAYMRRVKDPEFVAAGGWPLR